MGQVGFKNGGSGSTGLRYNGEIRRKQSIGKGRDVWRGEGEHDRRGSTGAHLVMGSHKDVL